MVFLMTIFNNNPFSQDGNRFSPNWMNPYLFYCPYHGMKRPLLFLCTCTGLELMTAIGVTAYLVYLGQTTLALISAIVFAKVIVFHFVVDIYDRIKSKKKPHSCNTLKA